LLRSLASAGGYGRSSGYSRSGFVGGNSGVGRGGGQGGDYINNSDGENFLFGSNNNKPEAETGTPSHIESTLDSRSFEYRRMSTVFPSSLNQVQYNLKYCPVCPPHKDDQTNLWKLFVVSRGTNGKGGWYCHRCREKGGWMELVDLLGGDGEGKDYDHEKTSRQRGQQHGRSQYQQQSQQQSQQQNQQQNQQNQQRPAVPVLPPPPHLQSLYTSCLFNPSTPSALTYLTEVRGLRPSTLRRFGVGYAAPKTGGGVSFVNSMGEWIEEDCVTFPWFIRGEGGVRSQSGGERVAKKEEGAEEEEEEEEQGENFVLQRVKYRSIVEKANMRMTKAPTGGKGKGWSFFGFHTIDFLGGEKRDVIITEGEYDAMSVSQALNEDLSHRDHRSSSSDGISPSSDVENSHLSSNEPVKEQPWVISLPTGCSNLPQECVELLLDSDVFNNFYLYFDGDEAGRGAVSRFSSLLGLDRVKIVSLDNLPVSALEEFEEEFQGDAYWPPKDGNDALRLGEGKGGELIRQMIAHASGIKHPKITRFATDETLRWKVFDGERDPFSGGGIRTPSFEPKNKLPARQGGNENMETQKPGSLDEMTKGFRPGELVVVSGGTGGGKTTFMSQASVDIARYIHENDISKGGDWNSRKGGVLWGSFEVKNERLVRKMIGQNWSIDKDAGIEYDISVDFCEENEEGYDKILYPSAGGGLDRKSRMVNEAKFRVAADRFSELPIHFLTFHGGTILSEILDSMEHAVKVEGVTHIVLDNLQFMQADVGGGRSSRSGETEGAHKWRSRLNSGFDKFALQDASVSALRAFATENNVCVIIVAHPRKESSVGTAEQPPLTINSLYGGAKLSQEADLVVLLQADPGGERGVKWIEVVKNRWDGMVGCVGVKFDEFGTRFRAVEDGREYDPYPNRRKIGGQQQQQQQQQHQQQSQQPQSKTQGIGTYQPRGEQQLRHLEREQLKQQEQRQQQTPTFGVPRPVTTWGDDTDELEEARANVDTPSDNNDSTHNVLGSMRYPQQPSMSSKRNMVTNAKNRPLSKNYVYFNSKGNVVG